MNRPRPIGLAVLVLLCAMGQASAQEAPKISDEWPRNERLLFVGDKVRITAAELFPGRVAGEVEWILPDTLVLRPKDYAPQLVPLASVQALEISRGNEQYVGAVLGGLLGILAGASIAGSLAGSDGPQSGFDTKALLVSAGAILGGFGGYFVGKQADRLVFGERWEEIPVSRILWETRLEPGAQSSAGPSVSLGIAYLF